jgi:hypothetical protein
LYELDPEALARLRGEIERVDGAPRIPQHLDPIAQLSVAKRHRHRQQIQGELRGHIAQWAGYLKANGRDDSEIYRTFYFKFGIDIATAQTLNPKDAESLIKRVIDEIRNME